MRYSTGAFLIILYSLESFGQALDYGMGGRAMSLGFAGAAISDEWSSFHNIGSLSGSDRQPSVAFSCRSLYAIEGLEKIAAVATWPFGKLCGTVNFFRFGDQSYNETRAGLGVSHRIGPVSLGMQLNYHQLLIENFGSRGVIYIDAGGMAELFRGFRVGAYFQNITQAKSSRITGEKFPILMGVGICYRPQEILMIAAEVVKNIPGAIEIRTGLEFSIRDLLFLRSGINIYPARNFFGIGIKLNRFKIDYALSTQVHLGMSHEVSVGYLIRNKK